MASLALPQTHLFAQAFRLPFLARPSLTTALTTPLLNAPRWAVAIPALESLLELLPPWLLAVPKKKVSHSRKSMRSANKGLKDKQNIVHCPACGSPKLAHHLCSSCYSEVSRRWKREANGTVPDLM